VNATDFNSDSLAQSALAQAVGSAMNLPQDSSSITVANTAQSDDTGLGAIVSYTVIAQAEASGYSDGLVFYGVLTARLAAEVALGQLFVSQIITFSNNDPTYSNLVSASAPVTSRFSSERRAITSPPNSSSASLTAVQYFTSLPLYAQILAPLACLLLLILLVAFVYKKCIPKLRKGHDDFGTELRVSTFDKSRKSSMVDDKSSKQLTAPDSPSSNFSEDDLYDVYEK